MNKQLLVCDWKNDSDVIYTSESGTKYTAKDFMDIAKGSRDVAEYLHLIVEWQHPETVLDESINDGDIIETAEGYELNYS